MELTDFLHKYKWHCIALWWGMQGMLILSMPIPEDWRLLLGLIVLSLSFLLYFAKQVYIRLVVCVLLLLLLLLLFSLSIMLKWFAGTVMFKIFYLFLETVTLFITIYGVINTLKALK